MDTYSAVYLGVLLVSVLLLIAALVFGFGHDAELSHDTDMAHDAGAGHETTGHAGHIEADGPSWLSSRVILGAAAGFGAFGLGAQAVGLSGWVTLPIALVGFFGMAIVIRQLVLRPMWRQQSNLLLSRDSYVGSRGQVTLGIRSGESGLVRFLDRNGAPVTDFAVSGDGAELPAGTDVLVVDVTAQHVVVDPDPLRFEGR
ncbi:NfeD family protein [Nakamurella sp.]|uniref:NfeD family protein n=1 Tax=Nakamurella sp. TaxID=1869182 RepID=UPI003784C2AB